MPVWHAELDVALHVAWCRPSSASTSYTRWAPQHPEPMLHPLLYAQYPGVFPAGRKLAQWWPWGGGGGYDNGYNNGYGGGNNNNNNNNSEPRLTYTTPA